MFKIKCIETVSTSDFILGKVYEVKEGILCDEDGFRWTNDNSGFSNIKSVNEFFSVDDGFHTKFKEVN